MAKKPHLELRTEAAVKKAVKLFSTGYAVIETGVLYGVRQDDGLSTYILQPTEIAIALPRKLYQTHTEILAIIDLRDLYRKRAPLTGINKKLKSAIQPKRKKKATSKAKKKKKVSKTT